MIRLRFPQDRTVFIYQGDYAAVLTPPRTGMQVFADAACTQLADILDPDSLASIQSSIIYSDNGLLPEFLGPNGVSRLWIRFTGSSGPGKPVDATVNSLLTNLDGPGLVSYTYTQVAPASVWTIDHPLPFRPTVTIIDSSGTKQDTDLYYPPGVPGRVISTASAPFAGTAELN